MNSEWFLDLFEADGGATQVLARYVKQRVGEGMEFSNEVARVVVSSNGCYYEFRDLPEEFSGALGQFSHQFVGYEDALSLLEKLYRLPYTDFIEAVEELSLLVVYDRFDGISYQNIYAYHFQRGRLVEHRMEDTRGAFRLGQLPRFFKFRLLANRVPDGLSFPSGMAFFIANPGERHLLVQVPYTHTRVSDLIARPLSQQLH